MMSEQKVPRSVEQRIVIKFLVGEKRSRPLKFTTDSNNSMGKSVSVGDTLPHTVVGVCGEFQRTGRFLQRGI